MGAARSQDEILARIRAITPLDDLFGVRRNDLFVYLDFDTARPWLRDGATPEAWDAATGKYTDPIAEAREYLPFAMGKAADHRGMSADRSIQHLREWAWLSGDPSFEEAVGRPFRNYGAPILRAVAAAISASDVWDAHATAGLRRMAEGLACDPAGCHEGCDR